MINLPKHLGGHKNITHTDPETFEYLLKEFDIKTMCDIGCGPGGMLKLAKQYDINAIGIDGDFTLQYPKDLVVIIHDFTQSKLNIGSFDLGWSCEFLEHVHEQFMDNYFSVFINCKVIVCTFSTSIKGHHHVNVKDQNYWDNQFTIRNFIKDDERTNTIRQISSMRRDFIRNTGTVYLNTKY